MSPKSLWTALAAVWIAASAAEASDTMVALARPVEEGSAIGDFGADVHIRLMLSQPVLWRVHTLDAPMRLVLEFGEVDWRGVDVAGLVDSDAIVAVSAGERVPGWSELVLELAEPLAVETAGMTTGAEDGRAELKLQLAPTDAKSFADLARGSAQAAVRPAAEGQPEANGKMVVMLDPGHGGIDPGAQSGEITEARLMMVFAHELAGALEDHGFEAVLTREVDVFVPLETRVSLAHEARADLFLSLHADALPEGHASGAAVYTLSDAAQATASEKSSERHARDDLVAGIDLSRHDDEIAGVLMSLARTETQPRAERLADVIVDALGEATGNLHKRPRLSADFAVLKAADIPSVLVELGFLSNEVDRARLQDAVWRSVAAEAIAAGIARWRDEDAEIGRLARQ